MVQHHKTRWAAGGVGFPAFVELNTTDDMVVLDARETVGIVRSGKSFQVAEGRKISVRIPAAEFERLVREWLEFREEHNGGTSDSESELERSTG